MGLLSMVLHHRQSIVSLFLSLSFLLLIAQFVISDRDFRNPVSVLDGNLRGNDESCGLDVPRGVSEYGSKCGFVRNHSGCLSKGYLNYLVIFYCTYEHQPVVGFVVLSLWLVILFYVLGNTTSEYFCPAVGRLSRILKLSPTIAGTTLLPLGNGANDVFSSVISFTRSGEGNVGLNSILGGAFFICCFVVGVLSISVSSRQIAVDKASFIRDVVFFLLVLCCLVLIIAFGKINFWFALCFVSLYAVYIGLVSVMHLRYKPERVINPPIANDEITAPLLGRVDEEKGNTSHHVSELEDCNHEQGRRVTFTVECKYWFSRILFVLELPLSLPRKLTIPLVDEENWSKPLAVASATLSPLLSAALFNTQTLHANSKISLLIYLLSALLGATAGCLALFLTENSNPPRRFLLPWLTGGFIMSIVWTYIIVEELVSLMVSFGHILNISPSILGLTVLAWGNSLGDLISNLGMAVKGGEDGPQVAVSGCYAGPLFNTLVGLGLSLALAAWNTYPGEYSLPKDDDLYETLGFLMAGLVWALVMLPKKKMQLDKSLGCGLLAIYLCFLCLRLVKGLGFLTLGD